ncbi:MAG: hypothetical protein DRN19_02265 [Thermoplasmata archaeon]|nr:MAG: hypothetical protein FE042_06545 [Thermoplasmata archaeon]RKX39991.1 MAG: hypothetical protein DRP23_04080 [Thermotogota bacterium]RLF34733.1 MAG: hypothetical protein DRN03_06365 [Thermoplasmata archaeon]RLF51733.1 MAG: hypothetical protein DRN19_02265 [Thermoplasmata archaeon]
MFGSNKISGISAVTAVLLSLFIASTIPLPVEAHMPGAAPPPEFELEPIVIDDGGTVIEITIDDVGNYHNERVKDAKRQMLKRQHPDWTDEKINSIIEEEFAGADGKCPCTCCAFRAVLLGISKIWGDEIPKRDDIKIISYLSTPGSCHCFQYITGTGPKIEPTPKTKGEFHIILPNGTEITNKSIKNLKKNGVNTSIDNWKFIISRKSTGDYFIVDVKDDVFPDDFFELRRKVKYGIPEAATQEELDRFRSEWEEVRNAFLTKPDWELFEGIEEPKRDVTSGIIFLSILGVCTVAGVIIWYTKRKRG